LFDFFEIDFSKKSNNSKKTTNYWIELFIVLREILFFPCSIFFVKPKVLEKPMCFAMHYKAWALLCITRLRLCYALQVLGKALPTGEIFVDW